VFSLKCADSILNRVGSILVPRGVLRLIIGCIFIAKIGTTYLCLNKIVNYKNVSKLGTGCKDTLVTCNSAFMALVI
jgi:hypothetical protein